MLAAALCAAWRTPNQTTTMRTLTIFTLSIALLLQAGCGGDDGRPDDLPQLYPVTITIIQSGNPLEDALITLVNKTPATYGTATGTTDASGIARLRTYGYNGVPAGDYAVVVEKRVTEGQTERTMPDGAVILVGGQLFQYVEAQFTQESSTPHSLTVTNRGATETFDVGEPVRVFMRAIPE